MSEHKPRQHHEPTTARLTAHARMRAFEMGVPTKLVKRIARAPEITYPARDGRRLLSAPTIDTRVAVLVAGHVVITVVWRTPFTRTVIVS